MGWYEDGKVISASVVGYVTYIQSERNPDFREPESFMMGSKQTCSGRRHFMFLSCSLYRLPWKERGLLNTSAYKMCRNVGDLWTVVFQQIALIDVVSIIYHDNIGDNYLLSFPS